MEGETDITPLEVKATLSLSDSSPSVELPVYKDTVDPDMIDIRKLYGQTDKFTYDPGFMSTASCNSRITYIDGDKSELLYRGCAIGDLASRCDFMEICYLLLEGELPNAKQKEEFNHVAMSHTTVHEQMQLFLRGFHRDVHPMAVLTSLVDAMSAFYLDAVSINNPREHEISQTRLIAKLPVLVVMTYKYNIGQPSIYPQNNLSYTGNFIRMAFTTPREDYKVNPAPEKILDRIPTLHANHEQNASMSAMCLAGSSGANPIAAIAVGIVCLWGSAHGDAGEAMLSMLEEIGTMDKVPEFIKQVKDKNSGMRLMGFGHRVCRSYSPCVELMCETCHEVLNELDLHSDPPFKLVMEPEKVVLGDEYFVGREPYPNVDFCSGIVRHALGIPTSTFAYAFTLARSVGWISQWGEMTTDLEYKIGHPCQPFNGAAIHEVPPVDKR